MIVRHDRSETDFLIQGSTFPAVCSLDDERARGIGTLIHPQFLLSAAHAAEKLSVGHSLTVAGTGHEVAAINLHPTWVNRSFAAGTENRLGFADLALLQLRRPVQGVDAVPLIMQQVEPGQVVTLVGNGTSGTGLTGGVQSDGRWRRATNCVEALHAMYWFSMRFDEPGAGTDLEGVPGAGDSGGPALIEVDGAWHLAGVASSEDSSAAPGRGRYGTSKFYVAVHEATNWIGSILSQAASYSYLRIASPSGHPKNEGFRYGAVQCQAGMIMNQFWIRSGAACGRQPSGLGRDGVLRNPYFWNAAVLIRLARRRLPQISFPSRIAWGWSQALTVFIKPGRGGW